MKENGGGHCGDGGVRADAVVMWWWQEWWGGKDNVISCKQDWHLCQSFEQRIEGIKDLAMGINGG